MWYGTASTCRCYCCCCCWWDSWLLPASCNNRCCWPAAGTCDATPPHPAPAPYSPGRPPMTKILTAVMSLHICTKPGQKKPAIQPLAPACRKDSTKRHACRFSPEKCITIQTPYIYLAGRGGAPLPAPAPSASACSPSHPAAHARLAPRVHAAAPAALIPAPGPPHQPPPRFPPRHAHGTHTLHVQPRWPPHT